MYKSSSHVDVQYFVAYLTLVEALGEHCKSITLIERDGQQSTEELTELGGWPFTVLIR